MNLAQINESYELRDERLDSIPENFERGVTSVLTASELGVKPIGWRFYTAGTPLWRFPSSHGVVLSSKPVSVKISRGETLFLAENENLGLYATGESRDEAIRAFCEQLIHFYEHYKELNWNRVTGEARRLKEIYENFFKETRK
ncbi:MAG: hypothetical protein C4B58_13535 [Deltaproteobacteria bacterium]|nr:MAG: hypothetical protein C4B58_13535 [Deltaproteobacteria bacterium]